LIQDAYAKIFSEGINEFEGDFDLLFFYKILAAFLQDREGLARPSGESSSDIRSWRIDGCCRFHYANASSGFGAVPSTSD
jgi:hypothetical protein